MIGALQHVRLLQGDGCNAEGDCCAEDLDFWCARNRVS